MLPDNAELFWLAGGLLIGFVAALIQMKRSGYVRSSIQCQRQTKAAGVMCQCLRPHGHPGKHVATRGQLLYFQ